MRTILLFVITLCVSVSALHIQIDFEGVVDFNLAYIDNATVFQPDDPANPYTFNYSPGDVFELSVSIDTGLRGFDLTGTKESEEDLFYQFDILNAPELISLKDKNIGFDEYQLQYSYGYGVVADVTRSLIPNGGVAKYSDPDNSEITYLYDFLIDKTSVWGYLKPGDEVGFGESISLPNELSGGINSISLATLTVKEVIRFAPPPKVTPVSEPSLPVLLLTVLSGSMLFFRKSKRVNF